MLTSSLLYRTTAVLLLLFAVGHTTGFLQVDPAWHADAVVHSMQNVHFDANGSIRTYWDFYLGFGFFVSAFMVLAAVTAWQLGSLEAATLAKLKPLQWTFVGVFVVVFGLSWRYFFNIPMVFSGLITVCLAVAAIRSSPRV